MDENTIQISPAEADNFRAEAKNDANSDLLQGGYKLRQLALQKIAGVVIRQMRESFNLYKEDCAKVLTDAAVLCANIRAKFSIGFVKTLEAAALNRMGNAQATFNNLRRGNDQMKQFRKRFPGMPAILPRHESNIVFLVGLVVLLIAAESLFNSRLFAEADAFGLVGGANLAVIVSVINVLPPLILGILATKSRASIAVPLLVWRIVCLIAIGYAVVINAIIWVLRNNKIAETDGVVDTSQSSVLFLVGIVAAGVAFWKGWDFPDLYAKVRKIQEQMENTKKNLYAEIIGPIDEKIELLQSATKSIAETTENLKRTVCRWHSEVMMTAGSNEIRRVQGIYHSEYSVLNPGEKLPDDDFEDAQLLKQWNSFSEITKNQADEQTENLENMLSRVEKQIENLADLKVKLGAVITEEIKTKT